MIDAPALVELILRRAHDTSIVNVAPMAALTKGLRGEEMAEIGLLKAAGAIAFTNGAKSVINAQVMRRALTYARDFDALVVHHTEDPDIVGEGVMNEGEFAARLGLTGVPTAAETIMLERDMRLVALTKARYHAASLTCAEGLEVLQRAKEEGLTVTASASINHLTLNEIDIGPYRTFLKLSPPLRAEEDRSSAGERAGKRAHRCGHVRSQSAGCRRQAPSVRGGQSRRNRTRNHAFRRPAPCSFRRGAVDAADRRYVEQAGRASASCQRKPAAGSPADVIVVDLDVPWVLDPAELKSKCKNTPFDEAKLEGRVVRTIVAGRTVYEYV